jgi:transposase InsO family protein
MAGTVAPMDVRMATALAGAIPNVAEFCRVQGISRKTFYKWRARFRAEGVDGLAELSRRPHASPGATPAHIEQLVVRLRKQLAEQGSDNGPDSIRWRLLAQAADGRGPVQTGQIPSRATIARILTRLGQVAPQPQKRPKSSQHRFVYARPNGCWQSDWTAWRLVDGTPTAIAGTLDDHPRLLVGLGAALGDGDAALVWSVMAAAIAHYGITQRSLTDNGLCYSAARRGKSSTAFETNLRALGCQPITSTPYHPQTCGKIERFWQTLKKWLACHEQRHGPTRDLADLTARLDAFAAFYNTERPHRALRGRTPAAAFAATAAARPAQRPLPAPLTVHHATVAANGNAGPYLINVGVRGAAGPSPRSKTVTTSRSSTATSSSAPSTPTPTAGGNPPPQPDTINTVTHVPRHPCHPCPETPHASWHHSTHMIDQARSLSASDIASNGACTLTSLSKCTCTSRPAASQPRISAAHRSSASSV